MGFLDSLFDFFKDIVGIMDDVGDFLEWTEEKNRELTNALEVVESEAKLISNALRELELARKSEDVFLEKKAVGIIKKIHKHIDNIEGKKIREDMVDVISTAGEYIRKLESVRKHRNMKFGSVQEIEQAIKGLLNIRKAYSDALVKHDKALRIIEQFYRQVDQIKAKEIRGNLKTAAIGGAAVAGLVVLAGAADLIITGGKNIDAATRALGVSKKGLAKETTGNIKRSLEESREKAEAKSEALKEMKSLANSNSFTKTLSDRELLAIHKTGKVDKWKDALKVAGKLHKVGMKELKSVINFSDPDPQPAKWAEKYVNKNSDKITAVFKAWADYVNDWDVRTKGSDIELNILGAKFTLSESTPSLSLSEAFADFWNKKVKGSYPLWVQVVSLAVSRVYETVETTVFGREFRSVVEKHKEFKGVDNVSDVLEDIRKKIEEELGVVKKESDKAEREAKTYSGSDLLDMLKAN